MHFQILTNFYLGQLPKSPFPAMDVVSKGIDFVLAFLPEILLFVFITSASVYDSNIQIFSSE